VTYTNGGWNSGTGVFTPAAGNPVSAGVVVGQFCSVYADGASAPTGFVGPTTAASGLTLVVGGAWAGPAGASGFPFNFIENTLSSASSAPPRVNLKNDQTYSITAQMSRSLAGTSAFQGYASTFGDGGRATIDGGTSGASYVLLFVSGSLAYLCDLVFQNNGATGTSGGLTFSSDRGVIDRVKVSSVRGHGITVGSTAMLKECEATGCNQSNTSGTAGFNFTGGTPAAFRCVSHDNTGSNSRGFRISATTILAGCVSDSNGSHGYEMAQICAPVLTRCVAYGNGGSGYSAAAARGRASLENCVFANNAAWGVVGVAAGAAGGEGYGTSSVLAANCAFRSNTSGAASNADATGSVTLTADPFTDAANRDFSLNDTAGGGADLRGAGRGTFPPGDPTVSYPDIGATQNLTAGGGGGVSGSRIFTGM
jgi:hypothetical protein